MVFGKLIFGRSLDRPTMQAKGLSWRDDPARFPLTTWHAVDWRAGHIEEGRWVALCGLKTGARQTSSIPVEVSCPECVQVIEHQTSGYFCRRCFGALAADEPCYHQGYERICLACWNRGERPVEGVAVLSLPGA